MRRERSVACDSIDTSGGMNHMNSSGKNRYSGRAAQVSICVARIAAAGLILISSLALAWGTSHSNGSKTDVDIKPPQPTSLHTKPPSVNRRHGAPAGHHAAKPNAKLHGHGQQSAQHAVPQARHSTGAKHGSHPQSISHPLRPRGKPNRNSGIDTWLEPNNQSRCHLISTDLQQPNASSAVAENCAGLHKEVSGPGNQRR